MENLAVKLKASAVLLAILMALSPSARGASIKLAVDSSRVANCFATYETLAHGAVGLKPASEERAYEIQAYRGANRMHAFVMRAIDQMGSASFYHRAVQSRLGEQRELDLLDSIPVNSARMAIVHGLSIDATLCDRQLDTWGAPPYRGLPDVDRHGVYWPQSTAKAARTSTPP